MKGLLLSRITIVWLILVSATMVSWEFGHGIGFHSMAGSSITIMIIAFLKVRFVILDFMEIRAAPLPMRLIGELWVFAVCSTLIALYLGMVHDD